jgi:hypothetical protein
MARKGGTRDNWECFVKEDWPYLLAEYEAEYKPLNLTMMDFAKAKELNYDTVKHAFKRLEKRQAMGTFHLRNKPLILKAQAQLKKALEADYVDPGLALRAVERLAAIEEPNAGLAQQVNITIPPLFASPGAAAAMATLTQPEVFDPGRVRQESVLALTAPEAQPRDLTPEDEERDQKDAARERLKAGHHVPPPPKERLPFRGKVKSQLKVEAGIDIEPDGDPNAMEGQDEDPLEE